MKRDAEKTGIYDEENAKALIGRTFRQMTGRSSSELTIAYRDFSYKVILDDRKVSIPRGLFDTYYKSYSDKTQREYVINQIKDKLQFLINSTKTICSDI